MGFNNDVFKKATKGLFGLVKDAAMDAVEDAIQDKLDDVLPTSNTTSTKSANNLPKFYEKPVIEEDNKIEKVVYSENMYNNIAPTSAFKKAIHFFNTNAESGIITYQIKEPNRELAVITTFKDMQNDNYVKREEFHYSDGNVRKYYHSKDLYGTNYFDDYYSESMDVQKVDNVVYKFEKEERILFEDILYGLKFTDKTKHRNDDGSYDIRLDLNNENDNKETISMYNRNINSDSKFDIDFANRLDIYASDNYITMHINPNGFITNIKKLRKRCLYKDYLDGKINVKAEEIETYTISQLNEPITIREDDLNPLPALLTGENNFTRYMSYEETKQLKTRDIIKQLPDERALIEDKKFYQVYTDTGRIVINDIELVYLPRKGVIEMKVGNFVYPLIEGKTVELDLGYHMHIFYDCSRVLNVIHNMPDFKRAKKDYKDEVRVVYCGNGKWTS